MESKRVRPTRLEIDLDNLEYNFNNVRKLVGDETLIAAVLKSNAYGHGSIECAKTFAKSGADRIYVSTIEEGIELRRANIKIPILLFNYVPKRQYEELINYELIPTIYTFESAENLNELAIKHNTNLKIHIKIDTGMRRLGFQIDKENYEDSIENILKIQKLSNISIEGIYSHLVYIKSSDIREEDRVYNDKQFNDLNKVYRRLREDGLNIPIRHISNSGGIIDSPEYNMEMVRSASLIYGHYPGERVEDIDLKPALEFKTEISNVKIVESNLGVSYGHTYSTNKKQLIGTIPVGYTDGYPRQLANRGKVYVKGKLVPIIGVICMDQMMLDLTDVKDVEIGDEVVLFGYKLPGYPSLRDLSLEAETIDQEIMSLLGRRVPRIYLKDGEVINIVDYLLK